MTKQITAPSWDVINAQIQKTSDECKYVANILSKRASRMKLRKKIFRSINIIIGSSAFIISVIIPEMVGITIVKLATASASIALFLDGILSAFTDEDPPERIQDYAFYIRNYSDKFETAILEETTDDRRKAKVLILIELASQNLNKVKTMWSWVDKGT